MGAADPAPKINGADRLDGVDVVVVSGVNWNEVTGVSVPARSEDCLLLLITGRRAEVPGGDMGARVEPVLAGEVLRAVLTGAGVVAVAAAFEILARDNISSIARL